MPLITPITREFGIFYLLVWKAKNWDLGQIFRFLQNVFFADFDIITPITPKFHEIRPITSESEWFYRHPLVYSNISNVQLLINFTLVSCMFQFFPPKYWLNYSSVSGAIQGSKNRRSGPRRPLHKFLKIRTERRGFLSKNDFQSGRRLQAGHVSLANYRNIPECFQLCRIRCISIPL